MHAQHGHVSARVRNELRRRIALEAARLISESGIRDFALAKRKAAERFGAFDEGNLPKNIEIEEALREHQRLFQAAEHPQLVRALREAAREAMQFFARFEPRLVGSVLEGTADRHSAVCLHLFADTPEEVLIVLNEQGIDYLESARRLRTGRDTQLEFPALQVARDGITFDLTIFPRDAIRQAPLDRVDEKPMRRASLAALDELLTSES
jgi:predicted nucleotidyltransferase